MKILEVQKINNTLSGKHILHDVSFSVKQGEIYGFLGPNGAGKTTTMKSILWFIQPQSGNIKIFWEDGISLESKKKIGFMPENTYLYKHLTGREFLRFNGSFFGLSGYELEKKVSKLLKKVWLQHAWNEYLKNYSKGMLQRVGLAQSLINDPELLFLDEPMSGLDPIWRKQVRDILMNLWKKGTTIFFNSHILSDVETMCDTVSIINHGRIVVQDKSVSSIHWWLEDFFMSSIPAL